jgi:hypothetical protein
MWGGEGSNDVVRRMCVRLSAWEWVSEPKNAGHGITRRLSLTGPNLLVYRMSVSRGETRFLAGPLCTRAEPHTKPSIEVLAVPSV